MVVFKGLPENIDENMIKNILENYGANYSRVVNVERSDDNHKAGDHYLSEIIHFTVRIKDDAEEKSLHFIVKDMGKGLSDFIVEVNGVEKELTMYSDILPQVNKLLGEDVTPQMYCRPSEKCIVLNDLSPFGYKLANRISLLDYEHSKLALKTLAKFHAGIAKYYEVAPDKFDVVSEDTLYNGNKDSIAYYFSKSNVRNNIKMLENIPEGHQFVKSIEHFYNEFWYDLHEALSKDFKFKVINHGDFWTTNILYRYEGNRVVDCKLIDFQLPRLSAPTLDLYQFITISMETSVRENQLDDLLNVYVNTLNEYLEKVDSSQRLTKQNLDHMMNETRVYGLICALTLIPIALCSPDDPLQLSDIGISDFREGFPRGDPYKKPFKQTLVQKHVISVLKYFRKINYI